jgi:hypothetical protein
MAAYTVQQRVGNFKTNKIGTIVSEMFRGAGGDFRGYVISTDRDGFEVWEESSLVVLPLGFETLAPITPA